jgi:hypothetical protein
MADSSIPDGKFQFGLGLLARHLEFAIWNAGIDKPSPIIAHRGTTGKVFA